MRSATSSDGPMALQRSVQAVVPSSLTGVSKRALWTSASEQEEGENAPQKREIDKNQPAKGEQASALVDSEEEVVQSGTDDYSSIELTDQAEAEFFRMQKD